MTTLQTITHIAPDEQAHEDFYHLMVRLNALIASAHEQPKTESESEALQNFEEEIAAATAALNICDKITGVRRVLASRYINDI